MPNSRLIKMALAAACLAASGASAHAALLASFDDQPSSLAEHRVVTVTVETDQPGTTLTSFDVTFTSPTSAFSQINPAGNPTIFTDNNDFFSFVGATVDQDSQFLFDSSDLLTVSSDESADELSGVFSFSGGRGSAFAAPSVALAQLVIPQNEGFDYEISSNPVRADNGDPTEEFTLGGSFTLIPEPASLTLAALGLLTMTRRPKTRARR